MRSLYCLTAKPKKIALQNAGKGTGNSVGDETVCSKLLNQLYVLVVCILILVQDGAVVQAMCRAGEVPMPWYKERQLHGVSYMCQLCRAPAVLTFLLVCRQSFLPS